MHANEMQIGDCSGVGGSGGALLLPQSGLSVKDDK